MRKQFTREYRIWKLMRNRCNNPQGKDWSRYGGRGIAICPAWDDFEVFLADLGPAPTNLHTLDRIDNNGPYSPENCRWATRREQSRNAATNRLIAWQGRILCLAGWADELGISQGALHRRLKRMPLERAMTPGKRQPGEVVTFRGKRHRLADLARTYGVKLKTVRSRLTAGRTLEEALM